MLEETGPLEMYIEYWDHHYDWETQVAFMGRGQGHTMFSTVP